MIRHKTAMAWVASSECVGSEVHVVASVSETVRRSQELRTQLAGLHGSRWYSLYRVHTVHTYSSTCRTFDMHPKVKQMFNFCRKKSIFDSGCWRHVERSVHTGATCRILRVAECLLQRKVSTRHDTVQQLQTVPNGNEAVFLCPTPQWAR